jgi:hypothetical protein
LLSRLLKRWLYNRSFSGPPRPRAYANDNDDNKRNNDDGRSQTRPAQAAPKQVATDRREQWIQLSRHTILLYDILYGGFIDSGASADHRLGRWAEKRRTRKAPNRKMPGRKIRDAIFLLPMFLSSGSELMEL